VLFLTLPKYVQRVGRNLRSYLDDLVEELILVTLDHPSIVAKRPGTETMVLGLTSFQKNSAVASKQPQQSVRCWRPCTGLQLHDVGWSRNRDGPQSVGGAFADIRPINNQSTTIMGDSKTKTAAVITIASAFAFVQGYGLGQFDNLSPSTIAATATGTANSSISATSVTTYNTITDSPIDVVMPFGDGKSQV
jgi:hypothetical protein